MFGVFSHLIVSVKRFLSLNKYIVSVARRDAEYIKSRGGEIIALCIDDKRETYIMAFEANGVIYMRICRSGNFALLCNTIMLSNHIGI